MKLHTVDLGLIVLYLASTLFIGLWGGRGVKSMRDYALGGKSVSTLTLVGTLMATSITGGALLSGAGEVFKFGLIALVVFLMGSFKDIVFAVVIAPAFGRFLNNARFMTVGDLMEHFYGRIGKLLAGCFGSLIAVGFVASQMMAIGKACTYFLDVPPIFGILVGYALVLCYATYGGIRSIMVTDGFQFFIILVVLSLVTGLALKHVGGVSALCAALPKWVFHIPPDRPIQVRFAEMALVYMIPRISPLTVQRTLMAGNVSQIKSAYFTCAFWGTWITLLVGLLGLLALVWGPQINSATAFFYTLDALGSVGLRAMGIIAFLAAVMSTADSFLNVASVGIVHDIVQPLRRARGKPYLSDLEQLRLTRWVTLAVGTVGVWQASRASSFIELILSTFNCWGSTVLVPLYAGLFGLRASRKTFFGAVAAGQGMYWLWVFYLGQHSPLGSFIPSLLANALAFYLGWLRDGSPRGLIPTVSSRRAVLHPQATAHRQQEEVRYEN